MARPKKKSPETNLTPAQKRLSQLWGDHVRYEFSTRNADDTLATMVEEAYVNHIPVLTGGSGQEELREFYSKRFIPQMPPDTEMTPVSRTIGEDQIVDEMVFKFTHTIPMDWILPGIFTRKRTDEARRSNTVVACSLSCWSEALQRNAKHEARLSNISGYSRSASSQK